MGGDLLAAQTALSSAIGREVIVFRPGRPLQRVESVEVLSQASVVALLACDTSIGACSLALRKLDALASKLGGRFVICVIQAQASSIPLEEFLSQSSSDYVVAADEARTNDLLRMAGITVSMSYPEVSLIDGTGRLLAVDVWPVLRSEEQKCFTLHNFPSGWHTNTWTASCLPSSDPCVRVEGPTLVSARAQPDSALQAGLYPGDAVIVRRIGPSSSATAASSLTMYINAPLSEDVEEYLQSSGCTLPQPSSHHLYLPLTVWRDLGLDGVTGTVTVVTTPYLDTPEAELVVLRRSRPSLSVDDGRTLVCAWLGVQSAADGPGPAEDLLEAVAALRAGQDEEAISAQLQDQHSTSTLGQQLYSSSTSARIHLSSCEVAMLQEYVARGQCRYTLLSAGQTLALPMRKDVPWESGDKSWHECSEGAAPSLITLVVHSTVPRFTAVVVGPRTQVQVL